MAQESYQSVQHLVSPPSSCENAPMLHQFALHVLDQPEPRSHVSIPFHRGGRQHQSQRLSTFNWIYRRRFTAVVETRTIITQKFTNRSTSYQMLVKWTRRFILMYCFEYQLGQPNDWWPRSTYLPSTSQEQVGTIERAKGISVITSCTLFCPHPLMRF